MIAALLMTFTAVCLLLTHGAALLPETIGGWVYLYRAALLAVIAGYNVFNWTHGGQTLGMRAWRLYAVDASGRPLSIRAALIRFGWAMAAWTPAALGVLWLYFDAERLALHDRLSNTRLVYLARP